MFICCLCRIPAFLPLFTHQLSGLTQTPAKGFWGTTFPHELKALAGTQGKHKGGRETSKWVITEVCCQGG